MTTVWNVKENRILHLLISHFNQIVNMYNLWQLFMLVLKRKQIHYILNLKIEISFFLAMCNMLNKLLNKVWSRPGVEKQLLPVGRNLKVKRSKEFGWMNNFLISSSQENSRFVYGRLASFLAGHSFLMFILPRINIYLLSCSLSFYAGQQTYTSSRCTHHCCSLHICHSSCDCWLLMHFSKLCNCFKHRINIFLSKF